MTHWKWSHQADKQKYKSVILSLLLLPIILKLSLLTFRSFTFISRLSNLFFCFSYCISCLYLLLLFLFHCSSHFILYPIPLLLVEEKNPWKSSFQHFHLSHSVSFVPFSYSALSSPCLSRLRFLFYLSHSLSFILYNCTTSLLGRKDKHASRSVEVKHVLSPPLKDDAKVQDPRSPSNQLYYTIALTQLMLQINNQKW